MLKTKTMGQMTMTPIVTMKTQNPLTTVLKLHAERALVKDCAPPVMERGRDVQNVAEQEYTATSVALQANIASRVALQAYAPLAMALAMFAQIAKGQENVRHAKGQRIVISVMAREEKSATYVTAMAKA